MQLTRCSDYAERVLLYLDINDHRRNTVREIAGAYGIPECRLSTEVHRLGRIGFVETAQGKHGGLRLPRPPATVSPSAGATSSSGSWKLPRCSR